MTTVYQVEYKIKGGVDIYKLAFITIDNGIFNEMIISRIYSHQFHNELEDIIKSKICASFNDNRVSNDFIVGKMTVIYKN